jgi:HPt (histidine-containing phosphotransfer) domain-containing protein
LSAKARLRAVPEPNDDLAQGPPLLEATLLQSIRALSTPGEKDFLNTLVAMFFKRAPELETRMEAALASNDAEAFEHAAHALKGTCGNLGAMRMHKACENLEHIGKSGDLSAVPTLMKELKVHFAEVKTALEKDWLV